MLLPVPLCAIHCMGYSSDYRLIAAVIIPDHVDDVTTAYHTQGQRVGEQSGLFGAHINEASFSPHRFDTGFGPKKIINGPYPFMLNTSFRYSNVIFPTLECTHGLSDGTYWYAFGGRVQMKAVFGKDNLVGKYYVEAVPYSITVTVEKLPLSQYTGIKPGDKYHSHKGETRKAVFTENIPLPTLDRTYISGSSWRPAQAAIESLWNVEAVFAVFKSFCNLALIGDWKPLSTSDQSIYWPEGELPDYSKVITTLLYTYEFNDPALAAGAVAPTAHYEIKESVDPWGHPRSRNVWIPRGGPFGTYDYEWLVQHAWMDAVSAIPKANDNSIQNIQALVELLVALKNVDLAEIPDLLWDRWKRATRNADAAADTISDMWMRYRYEYSTTKLDIEEYTKYGLEKLDRLLLQVSQSRCHGHASREGYECNCSMTWSEKGLTGLSRFCHALWENGLEPNSYVLWDFVPFSFVADWFVPVGDVLKTYSDSQYLNSGYYEFSDVVFSIRYSTGPIKGITSDHYVRWVSTQPVIADESYWFDDGGSTASLSTIVKRVCDSGCLISGTVRRH